MYITAEFISRIKDYINVSELVGRKVKLIRKGREYSGLCPFHDEKSPSFTVNDQKQFYHCFGCGAHGDIVKFTMDTERVEFIEAVKNLATEFGIALPVETKQDNENQNNIKILHKVNELASIWFNEQLNANKIAKNYLAKRNINNDSIEKFRIGFAPSGNMLKNYLLSKGIEEKHIFEAGLIIYGDHNNSYDRFRSRIMFPIFDKGEKIIGFGGRALGDEQPKYLNSPETILFKKGEILYNLYSKEKNKLHHKRMIVVEGYIDVISMDIAGFPETVASLGTAITETHIRKLWKITQEPIICLDGDKAGLNAMKRVSETVLPILKAGYSLKFAILPANCDPDDVIRTQGKDFFKKILETPSPLVEILWDQEYELLTEPITPERLAYFEKNLTSLTEKISDNSVKNHYKNYFRQKIWDYFKKGKNKAIKKIDSKLLEDNVKSLSPLVRIENNLFSIILNYPFLLEDYHIEEEFTLIDIVSKPLDKLRIVILEVKNFCPEVIYNKDDFKRKIESKLEKLEINDDFKYLYEEYFIFDENKNNLENIKSLWICNIKRYQVNLLMEEKQKALNLMTEDSLEKANNLQNQITILENNIAKVIENML